MKQHITHRRQHFTLFCGALKNNFSTPGIGVIQNLLSGTAARSLHLPTSKDQEATSLRALGRHMPSHPHLDRRSVAELLMHRQISPRILENYSKPTRSDPELDVSDVIETWFHFLFDCVARCASSVLVAEFLFKIDRFGKMSNNVLARFRCSLQGQFSTMFCNVLVTSVQEPFKRNLATACKTAHALSWEHAPVQSHSYAPQKPSYKSGSRKCSSVWAVVFLRGAPSCSKQKSHFSLWRSFPDDEMMRKLAKKWHNPSLDST